MSLFEVDVNALQTLLSALLKTDNAITELRTPLEYHFNMLEASFVSPNKGSFDQNFGILVARLNEAQLAAEEVRAGLNTLLTYVQQAEQLAF